MRNCCGVEICVHAHVWILRHEPWWCAMSWLTCREGTGGCWPIIRGVFEWRKVG